MYMLIENRHNTGKKTNVQGHFTVKFAIYKRILKCWPSLVILYINCKTGMNKTCCKYSFTLAC